MHSNVTTIYITIINVYEEFMSDFIKQILFAISTKFVSIGLVFTIGVIIARVLGPEMKGYYAFFNMNVLLFSMLAAYGLPEYLITVYNQNKSRQKTLFLHSLTISTIISICLMFIYSLLPLGDNIQYINSTFLYLNIIISVYNLHLRYYFLACQNYRVFNISLIITSFVILIGLIVLNSFNDLNIKTAIFMITLGNTITCMVLLYLYRSQTSKIINYRMNIIYFKYLLLKSYKFLLIGIIGILLSRLSYFYISKNQGLYLLGIYSVSEVVPALMYGILSQVVIILYPKLFSRGDSLKNEIYISIIVILLAYLSCIIVLLLFGETLIVFIYGDEYREAIYPMIILTIASGIITIYSVFYNILISKKYVNYAMYLSISGVVILFVLLNLPMFSINLIYTSSAILITNTSLIFFLIYVLKVTINTQKKSGHPLVLNSLKEVCSK